MILVIGNILLLMLDIGLLKVIFLFVCKVVDVSFKCLVILNGDDIDDIWKMVCIWVMFEVFGREDFDFLLIEIYLFGWC